MAAVLLFLYKKRRCRSGRRPVLSVIFVASLQENEEQERSDKNDRHDDHHVDVTGLRGKDLSECVIGRLDRQNCRKITDKTQERQSHRIHSRTAAYPF